MLPQTVALFALIGLALAGTDILYPLAVEPNNEVNPIVEVDTAVAQPRAKRLIGTKLLLGAGLAGAAVGGGLVAKKALLVGGAAATAGAYGGGYGSGYGYGHSYHYAPEVVHHVHAYPSKVTYVSDGGYGYGHGHGLGHSYGSTYYSSGYASGYGHGGYYSGW